MTTQTPRPTWPAHHTADEFATRIRQRLDELKASRAEIVARRLRVTNKEDLMGEIPIDEREQELSRRGERCARWNAELRQVDTIEGELRRHLQWLTGELWS